MRWRPAAAALILSVSACEDNDIVGVRHPPHIERAWYSDHDGHVDLELETSSPARCRVTERHGWGAYDRTGGTRHKEHFQEIPSFRPVYVEHGSFCENGYGRTPIVKTADHR